MIPIFWIHKDGFIIQEKPDSAIRVSYGQELPVAYNPRLRFDGQALSGLPDPKDVYLMLRTVQPALSDEQIIDFMLSVFHKYRFFRGDYLKNKSMVVGFIGSRGSGKSASSTLLVIIDFMLVGLQCWSNMPIKFIVAYGSARKTFQTEPLPKLQFLQHDQTFKHGVVLLDEVNIDFAEASRYMSGTNLQLSQMTQQLRKRDISIIWSAQSWNTVDNRLRWQTDFVCHCTDSFFDGQHARVGHWSTWRVMDTTGLSGVFSYEQDLRMRYISDHIIGKMTVNIRAIWNVYQTELSQGGQPYGVKELEKLENYNNVELYRLPPGIVDPAEKLVQDLEDRGQIRVYGNQIWTENNLLDNKEQQSKVGAAFKRRGWKKKRDSTGYYYIRDRRPGED